MSLAPLEARIAATTDQILALVTTKDFKDRLKKALAKKVNFQNPLIDWELEFFNQDLSVQDQDSRDKITVLMAELKSDLLTARKRGELHLGTEDGAEATPST